MQDGCAPRWDSRRLNLDWSAWDRRFGPLLDGSAFADLPRKGVPVECFYLPLHENWPSPMEGNYNGDYWADRAFPESYRQAFVAAARQIAAHFQAKGWTETLFQGFLNNKNNFKASGWSRGSSPWLLDEPANFQDYWALRYFAARVSRRDQSGRERHRPATIRHVFACPSAAAPDWSSAPTSRGRSGAATASTACSTTTSSAVRCGAIRDLVFERKRTLRRNRARIRLDQPRRGLERAAGGVVPGRLVAGRRRRPPLADGGNAGSWDRADELALFYPAWRTSRDKRSGAGPPIPSIRLKAYRRGQQDVEYLTLWSSCTTSRAGRSASRSVRP